MVDLLGGAIPGSDGSRIANSKRLLGRSAKDFVLLVTKRAAGTSFLRPSC